MSIMLVALIVMFLIVAGVVAAVLLSQRKGRRVTQPACGQCGYFVRGLSTLTCPECGADLREVGIVTPQNTRPIGPVGAIVIWSLLLPVPAMIISGLVLELAVPKVFFRRVNRSFNSPRSKAFQQIQILASGRQVTWQRGWNSRSSPKLRTLDLELTTNSASKTAMSVDPDTMTGQYTDASGKTVTAPIDQQSILQWMADAGVDTGSDKVQAEADQLANGVRAMPKSQGYDVRLPNFSGSGSSSSAGSSMLSGAPQAVMGFWLLLWLGGCVYLYRKLRVPNVA